MTTIDSRVLQFEKESEVKNLSGLGCALVFVGLVLSTALVFEFGFQYGVRTEKEKQKIENKITPVPTYNVPTHKEDYLDNLEPPELPYPKSKYIKRDKVC